MCSVYHRVCIDKFVIGVFLLAHLTLTFWYYAADYEREVYHQAWNTNPANNLISGLLFWSLLSPSIDLMPIQAAMTVEFLCFFANLYTFYLTYVNEYYRHQFGIMMHFHALVALRILSTFFLGVIVEHQNRKLKKYICQQQETGNDSY